MVDYYSYSSGPSFSSTLLDAIYRSIETETETETAAADNYYKDPTIAMKQQKITDNNTSENHRRACMIDKWMEKKKKKKKKKTGADGDGGRKPNSEAESLPVPRPKPVRTGCTGFEKGVKKRERRGEEFGSVRVPSQRESVGSFLKKKSSGDLKIYGELKEAREQPVSPGGGKLAAFLSSLFSGGGGGLNVKKKKTAKIVSNSDDSPSLKSAATTTCSSASSFSRKTASSRLSKTPPPSGGKASSGGVNGVKRSVRFSSVTKILDQEDQKSSLKTTSDIVIDHRELITARSIEKKDRPVDQDSSDGDDDDDDASYASSDLFELDNLSSIGYGDQLPVYETTRRPDDNRVGAKIR